MIILILVSLLPYILLLLGHSGGFQSPPIEQLFCSGGACAIYHSCFLFSCRKSGYSFLTITCFFFWIFLGLSPLMCALTGRWLWGDITFEMNQGILLAQGLCLVFLVAFYGVYRLAFKKGLLSRYFTTGATVSDAGLFLGLCFSLAASTVVIVGLGVQGTFFRAGYDSYLASGVSSLFIQNFFRPMPLLIGVPMLWVLLKQPLAFSLPRTWLAMATVGLALAVNFPLSVARFYGWTVISVFFYYILLHHRLLKRYWIAGCFLLLGLFGSFIVDALRYVQSIAEAKENYGNSQVLSTDSFYVGHVDAFEMLVYGTEFVEEKGHTGGRQALGVALFWVPRDFWPDKPPATGPLMGSSFINLMNQTANTNLSAPIVLEGYINLGIIGVVIFAGITGVVAGTLDRALAERRTVQLLSNGQMYGIDAIAAPLMGLWVYILRGSLLAAFAYAVGMTFAAVIMWKGFFWQVRQKAALR
jgi:hypothetical protein